MSQESSQPDWHLLPGKPVKFFGLAQGFERADLKRAYNRLIRVYKPERHPQEFQQIRAAYETLDEQLRYGTTLPQQPTSQGWAELEAAQPAPPRDKRQSAAGSPSTEPARPRRLVDRLREESPKSVYRELAAKEKKTPFDYYALAILSDVVDQQPMRFARWLVKGIEAHPREVALQKMLHAFLRGPQRTADMLDLMTLLPEAAKAIRGDAFYPITEAAWTRILRERPFGEFAELLSKCEAELRDAQIAGKMVFSIQMLRSALWKDDKGDWSQERLKFIEENFGHIPRWLEWEVDLLGVARDYLKVRKQYAVGGALRGRIDAALRDFFCESQEVGDQRVVACHIEILQNSHALLEEFPVNDEGYSELFTVWNFVTAEVASRQATEAEEKEVDQNVWVRRGAALVKRLDESMSFSPLAAMGWLLKLGRWLTYAFIWLCVFAVIQALGHSVWPDGELSGISVIAVGSIAAFGTIMLLKSSMDRRFWYPRMMRHGLRRYESSWRREVLDFQLRSRVPGNFLRALFEHLAGTNSTAVIINRFVQIDYAPAFLAVAQRFEV